MKTDRESGSDGGRETEDLRAILRRWTVAGPPPEIEEQLRRTFRRGRRNGRRPVWLAVAACLVVAAGLALLLAHPMKVTGRVAVQPAAGSPPAPPPIVEPKQVVTRAPVPTPPAEAKRVPRSPQGQKVIVEPGQAELLVQLARQLRGTRQAGPGASLPRMEAIPADAPPSPILNTRTRDEVLQHRTLWENVESEWPFAHWSL